MLSKSVTVSAQDGCYEHANELQLLVALQTISPFPAPFMPAFGGYCAFGASVGKKFVGDPEVWRIVDGTLYLNLDENIQDLWLKDVPGRIRVANTNWTNIKDKAPSEL